MLTIVFEYNELINQEKEEQVFVDKIVRDLPCTLIVGEDSLSKDNEEFINCFTIDACKTIQQFVENNKSKNNEWFLIISNKEIDLDGSGNQFVKCPYKFWSGLEQFDTKSFTEHAKKKYLYNELSWLYMESIANDTHLEVDFLKNLFIENKVNRIMDCCCGIGRHAARLGEMGFYVTGIDASQNQINTARKKNKNDRVEYIIHDARDFDLPNKNYDAAICMWTTYNYFSKENDIVAFLSTVASHLNNGGLLVLDSKNIPALEPYRFYHRDSKNGEIDMILLVYKRIMGMIQNSQYFYFINNGSEKMFYLDEEFVRFYSVKELQKLNSEIFELINVFGDFDKDSYDVDKSERMITVWRKLPQKIEGKIK